jgi:arylsulfatase A-like enzyme
MMPPSLSRALVVSLAAAVCQGGGDGRPSFVFLLSESLDGRLLRADSLAKIPNIRALLAGGSVRFDAAYSNSPVCAPSRSSLHSGRAPHKIAHEHNGMLVRGVWNNAEGLPPNYSTRLDQLLNASGYATLMAGKTDWDIGGHSLTNDLECYTFNVRWPYNVSADGGWAQENMCASDGPVAPGGSGGSAGSAYGDDWRIVESTAAFAATAPQPLYAFAGTSILHPAYRTNEYWFERASNATTAPPWAPLEQLHPCDLQAAMKRGCTPGGSNASAIADFYNPERIRRVRRVYLAALEEFDAMVGLVVAKLDAAGRWRDGSTTLVLAADHGDMQLEHQMFYKMVAYDGSSRVPLVLASPALAGLGAKTVSQPAQLLDIFPTLLGMAGIPVPEYADGFDLAPFLFAGVERDAARPPFVVVQNADTDQSMAWFAVVNGTHKLVQYGTGSQVAPQLFDLEADPGELRNLHNESDAARAAEASLDAQLRSVINYPSVAQDIANYELAQFRYWANHTHDWRADIVGPSIRWQRAFEDNYALAMAAAEAYLAQSGGGDAEIVPCDGRLSNLGGT